MMYSNTWPLMLACCWVGVAKAQWQLLPDMESQRVFAGDGRKISVVFHNPTDKKAEAELHTRLVQVSSATVIPLGVTAWKRLRVLPGQTVVESASLNFPVVKAETRFFVQWIDGTSQPANQLRSSGRESAPSEPQTNQPQPGQSRLTSAATVIGKTEVLVYPTNLLKDLKPLAGEKPIGVLDPENQLKPLLKKLDLEFADLEDTGLSSFVGKLAIVGPLKSHEQIPDDLADRIAAFARKGGAAVWIRPVPRERDRKFTPTFYTVPVGEGAVVVAQAQLVSGLADNPSAQLNLIHLAEYAVRHEPPRLPEPAP